MRMQARHWSRTAFAVAAMFAAMAVGCRLLLGAWPFDGALELAVLCLALGLYFQIVSLRRRRLPDPAVLLDHALQLASAGRVDEAIALLTKTIQESPHLWQALQYRGQLYLALQDPQAAERDFNDAIRLAPKEPHLHDLLAQARGSTMG